MNNLNSNLVICEDRAYHRLLHIRANTLRAGGDPNTERLCGNCGKTKPFSEFHKSKSAKTGVQPQCMECQRARCRSYVRRPRDRRKIKPCPICKLLALKGAEPCQHSS